MASRRSADSAGLRGGTSLPDDPDRVSLLAKYLKRVVVKTVSMPDFRPFRNMVEPGDIEQVVREFRRFLEAAVDGDRANRRTILEIR
jgi:phage head maturation protease